MTANQLKETGSCAKIQEPLTAKAITSTKVLNVYVNRFYQLNIGPCACVSFEDSTPPYRALHFPTGRFLDVDAATPYLSWIGANQRIKSSGGPKRVSDIMKKLPIIVSDDDYIMKVYYHYLSELKAHKAKTK